ncbi:CAAX amino terminal protease [Saccharicrinis fermentans DSM 9555 = JCM 21142]|uniref:CAAX amino terminal protease n=1 Tax=Saccharicrinis fermentans DSM 9555 = JCM 21142 TaxID=869213 RepID=W7YTJ3_9BACT|nr:CAAX amino terminal protease [Saccharicrinis fermentans DSM 9555 = JCM 21142]
MRQTTVKSYIYFLKHPNYNSCDQSVPQKIKELIKLYLITLGLIFLSGIFIELFIILDVFGEYSQEISKVPEFTSKNNTYIYVLIAMICGPVFEEFMFRLLLTKYNRKFIIISLSLIIGYFITQIFNSYLLAISSVFIYSIMTYGYPVIFALPLFIMLNRIKFDFEKIWIKNHPIIFYSMTLFFAIVHMQTLTMSNEHYLFLPILMLPFIVLSISLGYIRIKLGILYAIIFHFLINLPALIGILIRAS